MVGKCFKIIILKDNKGLVWHKTPGYLDTSCSPTTTWNLETLVWQWAAVSTVSEESRVPPQNGVERPLLGNIVVGEFSIIVRL